MSITLPKEPPVGLLVSMALRANHEFGLDSEQSQKAQLSQMKQIYEEISGQGFYKWNQVVEDHYKSLINHHRGE